MKLDRVELGLYIAARHRQMVANRGHWEGLWQDLADFVMPRHRNITTQIISPNYERDAALYDGTAIQANMILANGQLTWMTPHDTRWFSYDPPAHLKGAEIVENFYRICTEVAMLELARSNFYSGIHQLYLDRGAFGTGVMMCEEGKRSLLTFRKFDIGTYCIADDDESHVDTLSWEFDLTARQAVQWFGYDDLGKEIRKDFDDKTGERKEQAHTFIRHVFPRDDDEIQFGKKDAINMPIASVTIEKKDRTVVRISGYDEQPFFCSRYDRWLAGQPYGWCPAVIALPEARQLNFLQKQMDALAEVTAFPRMLIPSSHKEEIDTRAHGVTYFDESNPNALPKEWLTQGKYDVGLDRVTQKQEAINRAFHVDLFRMFADLDKQMTAREVMERSSEKLAMFSPTFALFTTEFISPMLTRVFKILYRNRMLPPVPRELMEQVGTGLFMPEPEVSYSSRIALAIKALENASAANQLEMLGPVMQFKPEIADNYDWDAWARGTARNAGLPERWLAHPKIVQAIREQRAQQQAEMQQQAQMAQMAESIGKAGSVKQDSMVGGMLKGMLPAAA